jgi:vancomycin permeability regulator SanA
VVFACDAPPGENSAKSLEAACTAGQLYREKFIRKVMIAGVSGKDGADAAESLRRLAVESGVLESDVILDSSGIATEAVVKSTLERFEEHDLHEILVVSDFYLLPRIKLCYRRFGKDVDTVPAEQPEDAGSLRELRHELVQEATALWVFYLQPLVL